ncbi:MAG: aromatic ring-hydroxylating dioxygenase subunit alpha [Pseudomonadota bacterium]
MKNVDTTLMNNWHVVASVEDCAPGSITATRLLSINLVIWRNHEPDSPIQVWRDYCPHRGVQLSLGEITNNNLACPYHGWQYNQAGKCVNIPAHPDKEPPAGAKATAYQCEERYGLVWVCLGTPVSEIPEFPEWDDATYYRTYTEPYFIKASAFRVMDNFLDVSHFPILHEGWLGDREHTEVADFEVKTNEDGMLIGKYQLHASRVFSKDQDDNSWGTWITLTQPLCHYCIAESEESRLVDLVTITPIDEDTCVARILMLWDDANMQESKVQDEYDETMKQDIDILHSQQPTRLPLLSPKEAKAQGAPYEIHVRSDKPSIAYRKWLRGLGITYGVC